MKMVEKEDYIITENKDSPPQKDFCFDFGFGF